MSDTYFQMMENLKKQTEKETNVAKCEQLVNLVESCPLDNDSFSVDFKVFKLKGWGRRGRNSESDFSCDL